jgi:hypothetical protein
MMTLEHPEFDGMTTTYSLAVHSMKETQLNSAAFVLSWYRQNVDPRANHARLETGPEGTPTGRTIISHEGGLPDRVMDLDFIRACLAFKNWFRSSRKKWATTSKDKATGMYEAIQSEESAARGENRNPSMNKVLSIYRAQRPSLSYDKVLLRFDEVFGAYLKAIGRRTDWEW